MPAFKLRFPYLEILINNCNTEYSLFWEATSTLTVHPGNVLGGLSQPLFSRAEHATGITYQGTATGQGYCSSEGATLSAVEQCSISAAHCTNLA